MKSKKEKKVGGNPRRGVYILPNLFTSASLFIGFYVIMAAIQGRYEAAAIGIFLSAIFDSIDGRVARFTGTTSSFGTEFDSLADLVAFGVAPATLVFLWALEPFGRLGWMAAFMFLICGALRLARFNVEKKGAPSNYFKGLPIPAAACLIASLILFDGSLNVLSKGSHVIIIFMIYFLSFLMVSSITYLSFKEFNIKNKRPFNVFVSIILIFSVIAYKPKIFIFLILFIYVLSGPVITLYRLYRRKSLKKKMQGYNISEDKDVSVSDDLIANEESRDKA